jgi:hypothetical protein
MDLGVQKTAAEHDPLQDPLQFGGLQDEPLVGPASRYHPENHEPRLICCCPSA